MNKLIIHILIICALINSPLISKSQVFQNKVRKYKKGVIFDIDRKSYYGNNLVFNSSSLDFIDDITSQPISIPLEEIQYVKAKTGTYAPEGALVIGGFMLLCSIAGYIEAESNPSTYVTNPEMIIYFTAGGVLVGLGGGALFSKEKIVYRKNQNACLLIKITNDYPFSNKKIFALTMHLAF